MSLLAIRKNISLFVVTLVAMQVLNLGLYAQDFNAGRDAFGYKRNIVNSVTVYIAEVIMNKSNAFPERKERPNQSEHDPVYKFQPFKIYASSSHVSHDNEIAQSHIYADYLLPAYNNHIADIMLQPPKFIN